MPAHDTTFDVLVIGGGAAGLSAAAASSSCGAKTLVVEREDELGGILNQCIHNGFGLHRFGEELTGPEFAAKDIQIVEASELVDVWLGSSVLEIAPGKDGDSHRALVLSPEQGLVWVACSSIVLACGCRERTRAQVNIAGGRPAGVFTAGSAQKLVNCDGAMVGREVVILGSGDIGLIMARRMTWEGAHVICVCELASEPGGLRRNIVQCLEDNDIPLHLSTTVTQVFGKTRLEAVELADVNPATLEPVPGTERRVECDTLLLSVGLIPENEVAKTAGIIIDRATSGPVVDQSLETCVEGIYVAGNELHVHDLADFVSEEGEQAGIAAARRALGMRARRDETPIEVIAGENVGSVTPQRISCRDEEVVVRLRTRSRMENARIEIWGGDDVVKKAKRLIVVPSEMQTIKLKPADLEGVGSVLTVSCVGSEPKGGE